jgi:hypothetical protein
VIAAIKPMNQIAIFRDDENSWRDTIDSHNVTLICDSQPGNDVDVANCDFLYVMSIFGEDLHSRTFIAAITNDKFAVCSHHCNFAWEPELTFFLARNAEVELETSVLLKDLSKK